MALHVAALAGNMDIRLNNIECIDKSFPSFLGRLKK
jgi:5-enolpyruvylshikimate-3-phosphate synthase